MTAGNTPAKMAGILYVLLIVTSVFSYVYISNKFYVFGDAVETARNILSSELLFRSGIFVNIISNIIFIFLALALYELLKGVNQRQATIMVMLVVVSAVIATINQSNQLAALISLSGAEFLSVFDKTQLDAIAYAFLRLHSRVIDINQVTWGLWLFPFGMLVYKSDFLPRMLGILLIIGGMGYLINFSTALLFPQYRDIVSTLTLPMLICELPIVIWLFLVRIETTKAATGPD